MAFGAKGKGKPRRSNQQNPLRWASVEFSYRTAVQRPVLRLSAGTRSAVP